MSINEENIEIKRINDALKKMENSRSWGMTRPLRILKECLSSFVRKFQKAFLLYRTGGVRLLLKFVYNKIAGEVHEKKPSYLYKNELNKILNINKEKQIIIFKPVVDWNIPLFQRPHHIAKGLAAQGFLYFYCTPNGYDNVDGFLEISEGCYLTNKVDLVSDIKARKIIHVYAADPKCKWQMLESILDAGDLVLYEYIDEIHSDIYGSDIPQDLLKRHELAMRDDRILCAASADKLYEDVKTYRTKNLIKVTNGVDVDHFKISRDFGNIPNEIKDIVDSGRSIIGYYGALAKWLDYELIEKMAKENSNWHILLIGWNYDKSIDKTRIAELENVTIVGPINYMELPKYAIWFDVSIIPFLINDVTESTSPVKLFEYMALGHPIVTTAMPECKKYKSPLVSSSAEEFTRNIANALSMEKNEKYLETLKREALENSWTQKSIDISNLIKQNKFV